MVSQNEEGRKAAHPRDAQLLDVDQRTGVAAGGTIATVAIRTCLVAAFGKARKLFDLRRGSAGSGSFVALDQSGCVIS